MNLFINQNRIDDVIETHKTAYDGHKDIDAGSGNDTNSGFIKNSDLFKIRYNMSDSYLELSSQNTSETSHASYIGLTRTDFDTGNELHLTIFRIYLKYFKNKL